MFANLLIATTSKKGGAEATGKFVPAMELVWISTLLAGFFTIVALILCYCYKDSRGKRQLNAVNSDFGPTGARPRSNTKTGTGARPKRGFSSGSGGIHAEEKSAVLTKSDSAPVCGCTCRRETGTHKRK